MVVPDCCSFLSSSALASNGEGLTLLTVMEEGRLFFMVVRFLVLMTRCLTSEKGRAVVAGALPDVSGAPDPASRPVCTKLRGLLAAVFFFLLALPPTLPLMLRLGGRGRSSGSGSGVRPESVKQARQEEGFRGGGKKEGRQHFERISAMERGFANNSNATHPR